MIENLKDEVWAVHPKYTEYAASNYGRIKHLANNKKRKEKLIKLTPNKDGYLQFTISKNGKTKNIFVHRFIYECFHQELIPDDLEVNHKSEKHNENFVENLELLEHKQNCNYGSRNKRMAEAKSKKVAQYDLEGNLIKIWKSTNECGRNNFCQVAVCLCCNNKYLREGNNVYKNFIWQYIEEGE